MMRKAHIFGTLPHDTFNYLFILNHITTASTHLPFLSIMHLLFALLCAFPNYRGLAFGDVHYSHLSTTHPQQLYPPPFSFLLLTFWVHSSVPSPIIWALAFGDVYYSRIPTTQAQQIPTSLSFLLFISWVHSSLPSLIIGALPLIIWIVWALAFALGMFIIHKYQHVV